MNNELKKETEKWQKKLKQKINQLNKEKEEGDNFIKNIKAYYEDSFHFYEKKDYVKAFECIIWAWSWFEIGKKYEYISYKE